MSLVPATVEPSPVAEHPRPRSGTSASWLVVCCYLLGAVALTWRLWVDSAGRVQAGDPHDVDLFAWYMRYAAAISHGRLTAWWPGRPRSSTCCCGAGEAPPR